MTGAFKWLFEDLSQILMCRPRLDDLTSIKYQVIKKCIQLQFCELCSMVTLCLDSLEVYSINPAYWPNLRTVHFDAPSFHPLSSLFTTESLITELHFECPSHLESFQIPKSLRAVHFD